MKWMNRYLPQMVDEWLVACLNSISKLISLDGLLLVYVASISLASLSKDKQCCISTISEGLQVGGRIIDFAQTSLFI